MLTDQIRTDLLNARKDKKPAEVAILSVLLGEIQNLQNSAGQRGAVTDTQVSRLIRKLIGSNQETLGYLKPGQNEFNRLNLENIVLEALLPQIWTQQQIIDYLRQSSHCKMLLEQRTHGQATGIAIKLLNSLHLPVEGGDVAKAVEALRNEN